MEKNGIKFKLERGNRTIEIEGKIEIDNTISRMGVPILCDCKGKTSDTGTPLKYNNGKIYCPECGKEAIEITTYEDYQDEEMENIHLWYFGTDYLTLQDLYKLSYTMPYEKWILISDYFMKLTPEDVDMGDDFIPQFVGWVTSNPQEVEEILGVKEELRIKNKSKQVQDKTLIMEILNNLLEEFSMVETPEAFTDDGKFHLTGEIIDNPVNPRNIYGGGEWFVIDEDYIWFVRNNSRDTDNWNFNNIYVKGSAGGIGKRILKDNDLIEKIYQLKEYGESLKKVNMGGNI